jgi:sigma-E factor negative regulatory protein RseA
MTKNNEHISALMDDEIDRHTLEQLINDAELQSTWTRYHLIGDCLRDTIPERVDLNIAHQVSINLESEPTVLAPVQKRGFNLKPVAGFAIAASVAMIAVLGIKQDNNTAGQGTAPVIAQNTVVQPTATADTYTFNTPEIRQASIKSDTPASMADQRMSGYLVNHNEFRSNTGMNGIMPYVRIVTIETQE